MGVIRASQSGGRISLVLCPLSPQGTLLSGVLDDLQRTRFAGVCLGTTFPELPSHQGPRWGLQSTSSVASVGENAFYWLIKACHNVAPPSFATGEGEQRELRSPTYVFTIHKTTRCFPMNLSLDRPSSSLRVPPRVFRFWLFVFVFCVANAIRGRRLTTFDDNDVKVDRHNFRPTLKPMATQMSFIHSHERLVVTISSDDVLGAPNPLTETTTTESGWGALPLDRFPVVPEVAAAFGISVDDQYEEVFAHLIPLEPTPDMQHYLYELKQSRLDDHSLGYVTLDYLYQVHEWIPMPDHVTI